MSFHWKNWSSVMVRFNKVLALLALSLFFTGCSEKIIDNARKSYSQSFQLAGNCQFSVTPANTTMLENATSVKIDSNLFEIILSELKGRGNSRNFWSTISAKSKDELIYNLNLSLSKDTIETSAVAYQAVALFFEEMLRNKDLDVGFQVIALNNKSYVFSVEGETIKSHQRLRSNCGRTYDDYSGIFLPANIAEMMSVKNLIDCRGKKDHVVIMHTEASTFVRANDEFIQVDNASFLLKETKIFLKLDVSTRDLNLNIDVVKKWEKTIEDVEGSKAMIVVSSAENAFNAIGACSKKSY